MSDDMEGREELVCSRCGLVFVEQWEPEPLAANTFSAVCPRCSVMAPTGRAKPKPSP
jgi:uncharacterized C2H2 Zn-finger protein